jgi:hypothetical protein
MRMRTEVPPVVLGLPDKGFDRYSANTTFETPAEGLIVKVRTSPFRGKGRKVCNRCAYSSSPDAPPKVPLTEPTAATRPGSGNRSRLRAALSDDPSGRLSKVRPGQCRVLPVRLRSRPVTLRSRQKARVSAAGLVVTYFLHSPPATLPSQQFIRKKSGPQDQ